MIQSADDIVRGSVLHAHLCIVGGGPAGITLAMEMIKAGRSVLLLESGTIGPSAEVQKLNAGEVVDEALHSPADKYRQRCLGGGTTIWGGRCVPFDPIDFETRSWMDHSGWPISYHEIERFYPAANALCEAGEFEYDARLAIPGGMRPLLRGFAPRNFNVNAIERFSCPTNFGRRYDARLRDAASLRVLLRATVTRLQASSDGARIESLEVRNSKDLVFRVVADQIVLALGGIETPRFADDIERRAH